MPTQTQIFVQSNVAETRLALLVDDRLQELHVENSLNTGLLGNIYKGKVARVLPGMEAAFIDIGEEKNGFLPARELVSNSTGAGSSKRKPSITSLLHQGQNCLVQVIKESVGDKGPQLSANLSLPTRNLVYLPYARPNEVVISNKIEDAESRNKLKWIIDEALAARESDEELLGSIIIRTNAAAASVAELTAELDFLLSRQARLQQQSTAAIAPAILLEELPLHLRALRDWLPTRVDEVVFNLQSQYKNAIEFAQSYFPDQRQHLRMTEKNDESRLQLISQSTQEALSRTVSLPSGANLVFDYTAALTVVDVNTASFVGKKNPQFTLLHTNLEAAKVLAQQLRLRNIGGIIIVDFIDMETAADRQKLMQVLQAELRQDPVPTTCAANSDLGLVEISRQRSRESLIQSFKQYCESCDGSGWVLSSERVCQEILVELADIIQSGDADSFTVKASAQITRMLTTKLSAAVQELRDSFAVTVNFESTDEVGINSYLIQLG